MHAAMAANPESAGQGDLAETEIPEISYDGTDTDIPATATEDAPLPTTEQLSEVLSLSTGELATLDLVAPLVATTPRRAKRFGNVYTVVRARLSGEQSVDTDALAVAAAMLLGAPRTLGERLRGPAPVLDPEVPLRDWAAGVLVDSIDPAETIRVESFLRRADRLGELSMKAVIDVLPPVLLYV